MSIGIEAYSLLDELIRESGCSLLFFDEIQSAPRWELYLRQKLEEHYTVVVTGYQKYGRVI
jgi:predicted AAA+ superfamily ATPase